MQGCCERLSNDDPNSACNQVLSLCTLLTHQSIPLHIKDTECTGEYLAATWSHRMGELATFTSTCLR